VHPFVLAVVPLITLSVSVLFVLFLLIVLRYAIHSGRLSSPHVLLKLWFLEDVVALALLPVYAVFVPLCLVLLINNLELTVFYRIPVVNGTVWCVGGI